MNRLESTSDNQPQFLVITSFREMVKHRLDEVSGVNILIRSELDELTALGAGKHAGIMVRHVSHHPVGRVD